ncbi:MAG: SIS domain-containing protein [Gammaproteobacteria bacterium]|jgi:D-sedoheptulose 7-phosphate isomerase|nr:SIS domain-containing protein [Gammaproteobacteria bacterium]MDH5171952.1 SIS domain-containing protein [Gammaproteobacteria bacterium]
MDYYQILSSNFQGTIDTIALSVDELAEPVGRASELMVQALLEDRKIIACGNGVDAALAQLFACNLISRFEHDRPALPALALGGDGACLTAIAHSGGLNDIFSRQLRALGQAGDVMLCISSAGEANNLLRAVQAAHEREMSVVVLSNATDGELGTLLQPEDVEIRIDSLRRPRVVELHAMTLHCLCELIERSIFGSYPQE